jgi:hypothetical protein
MILTRVDALTAQADQLAARAEDATAPLADDLVRLGLHHLPITDFPLLRGLASALADRTSWPVAGRSLRRPVTRRKRSSCAGSCAAGMAWPARRPGPGSARPGNPRSPAPAAGCCWTTPSGCAAARRGLRRVPRFSSPGTPADQRRGAPLHGAQTPWFMTYRDHRRAGKVWRKTRSLFSRPFGSRPRLTASAGRRI